VYRVEHVVAEMGRLYDENRQLREKNERLQSELGESSDAKIAADATATYGEGTAEF